MADRTTKPRIVVTGMGVVSPLAANVETTWKRLIAGQSGIRRLDDAIVPDVDCKLGGVVPDNKRRSGRLRPRYRGFRPRTARRWTVSFSSRSRRRVRHWGRRAGSGRRDFARADGHRHRLRHRRFSDDHGRGENRRKPRREEAFAVHGSRISRQSRGGKCFRSYMFERATGVRR